MLCNCGFVVTLHWKQLIGHLGVSLDERKRLEMLAMVHDDFNHALEEGLDIWLRGGHKRSWEQLIEGVELLEPVTADNMRHALQGKRETLENIYSILNVSVCNYIHTAQYTQCYKCTVYLKLV